MIALVLQARLGSTRLPGKALLDLGGRPLLCQVMDRLALIKADLRILACPHNSVEAFAPLAQQSGYSLIAGPEDDVLERFCMAIRAFNPRWIIRATADNPFVSYELGNKLVQNYKNTSVDYAGFTGMPMGMGVEFVNAEALIKAAATTKEPRYREHVCPYLYEHPDIFRIAQPQAPCAFCMPHARVTIDTPDDLEKARIIFAALPLGHSSTTKQVMRLLGHKARTP